jgi:hypothetical protein
VWSGRCRIGTPPPNTGDAVGDRHTGQAVARLERRIPNSRNRFPFDHRWYGQTARGRFIAVSDGYRVFPDCVGEITQISGTGIDGLQPECECRQQRGDSGVSLEYHWPNFHCGVILPLLRFSRYRRETWVTSESKTSFASDVAVPFPIPPTQAPTGCVGPTACQTATKPKKIGSGISPRIENRKSLIHIAPSRRFLSAKC